jgi:HD-like signal output (HDOD) protein
MKQAPTSNSDKKNQIRGLLKRSTFEAPPIHQIVDEIFFTTLGGAFNVRTLADRIQQDELLTGAILEICRLPYYSGNTPIRNMNQVIHRLGPEGLRSVSLQAFLDLEIYTSESWEAQLKQLRTYSIIVGQICRVIARYTAMDGDEAFMAGLLHRIGFAVGLKKWTTKSDDHHAFWEALELTHTIFGKMTLQEWGMPEKIQAIVAHYGQTVIDQEVNLYCSAILVAEELAKRFRFEFRSPNRSKDSIVNELSDTAQRAIQALEIDEGLMRKIYMDSHFVLSHGLRLNI